MGETVQRSALTLLCHNAPGVMGANAFVPYGDNEVGDAVEALEGQPDVVLECVGSPGFVMKGIQHVRTLGKVLSTPRY